MVSLRVTRLTKSQLNNQKKKKKLKNRSQKRYVFRFIFKLSTVGLSQAAPSPLREFHRFADALTKLLDPYLPGFPGGTVSKFDSADLRTLIGLYGTTNLHRYPGAKPCNIYYMINLLKLTYDWLMNDV